VIREERETYIIIIENEKERDKLSEKFVFFLRRNGGRQNDEVCLLNVPMEELSHLSSNNSMPRCLDKCSAVFRSLHRGL